MFDAIWETISIYLEDPLPQINMHWNLIIFEDICVIDKKTLMIYRIDTTFLIMKKIDKHSLQPKTPEY